LLFKFIKIRTKRFYLQSFAFCEKILVAFSLGIVWFSILWIWFDSFSAAELIKARLHFYQTLNFSLSKSAAKSFSNLN